MRMAVPENLVEYVGFRDGKTYLKKELPENLKEEYKKFSEECRNAYLRYKNNNE